MVSRVPADPHPPAEQVAAGFGLLEGPVWDAATATLLVADTVDGGVWRLDGEGGAVVEVPGRRGIGGLALHRAGGYVVSGKNVALRTRDTSAVLLDNDPTHGLVRFNDLTTDAPGRVYVGHHGFTLEHERDGTLPPDGLLHLLDLDGTSRIVARGISVANGLAPSPDGRLLYVVDSGPRTVTRYAVDRDGDLREPRLLHRWAASRPDGLAVAADGSLWVALVGAGAVVNLAPTGEERRRLAVPDRYPTNVCFGGDDLRTLFVTTGGNGAYRDGRHEAGVYRLPAPVPGSPVAPAAVAVPATGTPTAG